MESLWLVGSVFLCICFNRIQCPLFIFSFKMAVLRKIILLVIAILLSGVGFNYFIKFAEICNYNIYKNAGNGLQQYKPGATYLFLNEGFTMGKINAGGYLGKYYPLFKNNRNNLIRIALVGDSFIQAFQLFDKHNVQNSLESNLKQLGYSAQVIRFGYSGYQFEDMVYLYNQEIVKYNPDFVLYFVDQLDLQNDGIIGKHKESLNKNIRLTEECNDPGTIEKVVEYLKQIDILRFIFSGYSKVSEPQILNLIFDKFAPEVKRNYFDDYKINSKTLDLFSLISKMNSNETCKQLLLINVRGSAFKVESRYLEAIKKSNIQLINLEQCFIQMLNEEIDPFYWKVTKKNGHWNHEAHKRLGSFIALELDKVIKSKVVIKTKKAKI